MFQLKEIGLRMLELIAQNLQARAPRRERNATADGMLRQVHQLLSGVKPVVAWGQFMQLGGNRLHLAAAKACATSIEFEQRQSRWSTRVREHLAELGKQHL